MIILALDASSPLVSLAVCDGPRPLAERAFSLPPRQSAQLLDAVPALLGEAGLAFSDLSAVAVGRGPGSYTGLRVAMTAARAWALPFRIPVWTSPGPLAAAAALFRDDSARPEVLLAGPVRRGLSWTALFRRSSDNPAVPVQIGHWNLVPDAERPAAALERPPTALDLVHLHSLGLPSDLPTPLYLNPAVNTPPRFAADGSPLP